MNKRLSQTYAAREQYVEETASEDLASDDFSYQEEEEATPPVHPQQLKINAHPPRPQTATQYLHERRISSSPPARFLTAAQQQIIHQHQLPLQKHLLSQHPLYPPPAHPPLGKYYPGQPLNPAQQTKRQPIQRPRTAHTDNRFVGSTAPKVEANFQLSDRLGSSNQQVPIRKKVFQQYTPPPRFAQSELNRTSVPISNPKTKKRPINANVSGTANLCHQPAYEKVLTTPLGFRYEESRSSAAAKNIALNFQTSQSSDLTFDKDKELRHTNYEDNLTSGLNNDPLQPEPTEVLAKSVSQIQTHPIDHLCGDGHTKPSQSFNNGSFVIEQAVGLEKSKKMIVNLIDSAIEQLKTRDSASKQSLLLHHHKGDGASVSVSTSTDETGNRSSINQRKKMECIGKLEEELTRLKILEEFNEYV